MHVQVLVGVGPTGVWGSIGPRVRQRLRPHAPFRMRIHTHTHTHTSRSGDGAERSTNYSAHAAGLGTARTSARAAHDATGLPLLPASLSLPVSRARAGLHSG